MKLPRIWFNYELTTAIVYLWDTGWRMRCHVLVIGPLAFQVAWRYPRTDVPKEKEIVA